MYLIYIYTTLIKTLKIIIKLSIGLIINFNLANNYNSRVKYVRMIADNFI